MSWRNLLLLGVGVFLVQLLLSELLMIRGIRPDFLIVYLLYVAIQRGSTAGVVVGFVVGIFEDLLSAGSLLGLAPLTKSVTGFLLGRLQGRYPRMSPVVFHIIWILILLIHFFLYDYIRFQQIYESSQVEFWTTWFYTVVYTMVFMGIMQVMFPLHRIQPAEQSE